MNDKIILYPSNWLYNAGVVGFLKVIERIGESVENFLKDDGGIEIDRNVFKKLANEAPKLYFGSTKEKVASIVGKNSLYTNYLQRDWKNIFNTFIELLTNISQTGNCDICGIGYYISSDVISLQKNELEKLNKFRNGIRVLDIRLNALLAPSQKFSNSFWNNNITSIVCDLCGYILIHHHLALTKLSDNSDNSEIFINAPSFKLMWYLNKYCSTIYEKEKIKSTKEILGISLIEATSKLHIQLGRWEKMNIEVVSKYKERRDNKWEDKIDFFSLPAYLVDLLIDKEITSLLRQIGEFKILNMVLDERFKEILQFGERILKISLKPEKERGEYETKFLNNEIKLKRNEENLIKFSQNLFKLYALIETKLKKEEVKI
ncbi:MAG: hypothetical protein NC926_00975 [Candidatus Omnitrophica bacterium]|nr:hypothetical protein [Candidatus Omnitrophota bacterium]